MQNSFVSPVVELYKSRYFSDLVNMPMLADSLLTKPEEITTTVSYIMGRYKGANLTFLTSALKNKKEITTHDWEWSVMIDAERPSTIISAKWNGTPITPTNADTLTPGLGNTTIEVRIADKWYGPGCVVNFDGSTFGNFYQARVEGAPIQDGNDYIYTLRIVDALNTPFIPGENFLPGAQMARSHSLYEEYSEESDIVNYSTPFKLRNYLNTLRLHYDCTGDAYNQVMIISIKDPRTNKSTNMWSRWQEWVAMEQFYCMQDRMLLTSRSNIGPDGTVSLKGTNGYPVYSGAGIIQQIGPSNIRYYTKLTTGVLEDFLVDMSYNLRSFGDRKYVALTGELGMRAFDQLLKEKMNAYNLIDTHFVTGTGQNLTFGGQFKTYKMTNGIELTLMHEPMLDDYQFFRKRHPVTGFPVSSYNYIFLDVSPDSDGPNIVKVVRKGRELIIKYIAGMIDPTGKNGQMTMAANAKDGYSVELLAQMGVMIRNPMSCGMLLYNAA